MKITLLFETLLLYIALPLLIITDLLPKIAVMPLLWFSMVYALFILRKEGAAHLMWHIDRDMLQSVLVRFAVLGTLLMLAVWAVSPERLFSFPETQPGLWLAVMLLYPLLSALAQEIIFRAFVAYRFEKLIRDRRVLILLNALLFSFVHAVFGNLLAVVLSFLGGVLFMDTYLRSRSVAMSTVEHALYGNLIFTLGIGTYFYHGSGHV